MTTGRLSQKAIIVTGGSGGIGAASCKLFAAQGANVVVADINGSAAEDLARQIVDAGGNAIGVGVDVTKYKESEAVAERTLATFGRIDGIYANAGVSGGQTAHAITPEEWRRVVDIDLTGAFFSVKAVLPAMMEQKRGSILFQASVVASNGIKGVAAYSAAKAGLVGLSSQMAIEYAELGIRVNCVSPGTTRTPLVEAMYVDRAAIRGTTAESDLAATAAAYPMKRLGTTEEIANLAAFLLSDEASFISGVDVPVDGAFSAA